MKEVKTTIDALEVGMYVSRLDRPWIDTPFVLEGMRINSKNDIEGLRKYTSFVFVDTEQGPTPDPEHWISISEDELEIHDEDTIKVDFKESKSNDEYKKLRKAFYEIEADFEEELEKAKDIKNRIEKDFKKILTDMSQGQDLDVATLKDGIHAAVASIIRNPSAFALLIQLEKSNEYAYSHALSSSIWCGHFGRHLGFEVNEIEELALGGMLLDLGKIKLPPELLTKKGQISPAEAAVIKKHVDYSVRILAKSKGISTNVMRMVATHHERANGNGYPQGIENKDIPIYGRIAGIVDSYDAMTTPRPYIEKTMSPNEAINELYKLRDSSFQSELVEQFIQTVGLYPTGSLVELNSGAVAVVLEVNDLKRLFPTVMIVLNSEKEPVEDFETVNLAESQTGLIVKKALPTGAFGINIEELFI
jgi:HD-GYP domain-containing protein (c-di-GMP phosphodiesterase class II)